MVLVDDLLTLPVRGLLWIFREIHHAAQEELANESEAITTELSHLYMMLETGKISEGEFAAEEKTLLERLDRIQRRGRGLEDEGRREPERERSETRRAA